MVYYFDIRFVNTDSSYHSPHDAIEHFFRNYFNYIWTYITNTILVFSLVTFPIYGKLL